MSEKVKSYSISYNSKMNPYAVDQQTPVLNPSELYLKRKSKDQARLRTYNKILEQIYQRIRNLSNLQNSPCYLLYTIPPFFLGLPVIDMTDCVTYVIYQLRHAGYEIRYTYPNLLYISWQHHEKSYLLEQSPIMQAMMESAERTQAEIERKEKEASRLLAPKKSQRKVRMQAPGGMQSASSMQSSRHMNMSSAIQTVLQRPFPQAPSAGPAPASAADYVPPSTFLRSMTNPE
jgi:hypothetical protein